MLGAERKKQNNNGVRMKETKDKIKKAMYKIEEYLDKHYPDNPCPIEIGLAQVMLEQALKQMSTLNSED